MITKERLYKHLENLPDILQIEQLIEELLLIDKIDNRIVESHNDDTITEEQLSSEIKKW